MSPTDERPAAAPHAPSETELLADLRAGKDGAYESMVRAFGPRLHATVRRLLANDEDARDALQETFLSAFKAIDRFDGNSRLYTWLHRIATNAALMRLRTKSRKPEDSIEDLLPTFKTDGHHKKSPRSWSTPLNKAQVTEARELVRTTIDKLPESYRTVLVLRDIDQLDTARVAEVLEITPNAVKVRLHRARQALRTLLSEHFEEEA